MYLSHHAIPPVSIRISDGDSHLYQNPPTNVRKRAVSTVTHTKLAFLARPVRGSTESTPTSCQMSSTSSPKYLQFASTTHPINLISLNTMAVNLYLGLYYKLGFLSSIAHSLPGAGKVSSRISLISINLRINLQSFFFQINLSNSATS